VDPQAPALGENEQLGVEEPGVVFDLGRRVWATRAEIALKPH
jgi:hypothetical protein